MRTWHFSNFYFFYFTTVGVMVPYWGLFLQSRGFDAQEIGQLMAIFLLTKLIAPNIWASIADNMIAKKGSSLGLLKQAAIVTFGLYCLLYVVNGFWATAIVMFSFCVFWNASLPQLEAATLNHLKERRDKYGQVRLWGSVGFIVMVQSLGLIMDVTGPSAILPAGAIALLSVFFASLLMRNPKASDLSRGHELSNSQEQVLSAHSENETSCVANNDFSPEKINLLSLINKDVVFLLTLCVFMQISHAPWHTFFSIYLEDYGYSKSSIGALWSIGVVFEIFVFIVGYRLLKYFRLANLLTFTFLIAAIRWIMVSVFPESGWLILVTQVMHCVTYGLYHSVMIKLIDRLFQGRYQIRGQALYSSVTFGLGGAIGSFASGYIWTVYGHNELFLFSGLMMLFVFVISLLFTLNVIARVSQQVH